MVHLIASLSVYSSSYSEVKSVKLHKKRDTQLKIYFLNIFIQV